MKKKKFLSIVVFLQFLTNKGFSDESACKDLPYSVNQTQTHDKDMQFSITSESSGLPDFSELCLEKLPDELDDYAMDEATCTSLILEELRKSGVLEIKDDGRSSECW